MKKTIIVSALTLCFTTSVLAKDIIDTAVANGNFKTLATALTAAGLIDTLKGPGPFTVFAPTDEAFAKIPKADLDALLKDKAKLSAVKALNLNQEIEDILITLSNQIHIIDISPNKKFMIYLAADSTKANLGMTRAVLRKHKLELEKNLA